MADADRVVFLLALVGLFTVCGLVAAAVLWVAGRLGLVDLREYHPPPVARCTCVDGRPCPLASAHPWRVPWDSDHDTAA